ncbi:MAG: hypothetical protein H8E37_02065 [Planctomycetes bacterium]|nr:hypothetical protein [Planctomycetota bacterium]
MDPRDFLALTGYGTVGSLLLALGLLGCLLHRQSVRLLVSALVALVGVALLFVGSQQFHGDSPTVQASLALVVCGTAVAIFIRSRQMKAPTLPAASDSSSMDSAKSAESGAQPAKADS